MDITQSRTDCNTYNVIPKRSGKNLGCLSIIYLKLKLYKQIYLQYNQVRMYARENIDLINETFQYQANKHFYNRLTHVKNISTPTQQK